MSYIAVIPREQLMLPMCIDEFVSSDNIVRYIETFVDKALKEKAELLSQKGKSDEGRPGYSPNCLCKLLIYGYLNSISSSRRLENETKRNLEVIWLMNNLQPDFWTISDFRKENKELIKQITIDFRQFLKDCDYINRQLTIASETKIKAYPARNTISLKLIDKKLAQAEKEIERYFSQLNETDAVENEQAEMLASTNELKQQIADLQKQVEELKSQKRLLK